MEKVTKEKKIRVIKEKQIKPKISVRFVYSMAEIKPIEGMIYIVYKQQK